MPPFTFPATATAPRVGIKKNDLILTRGAEEAAGKIEDLWQLVLIEFTTSTGKKFGIGMSFPSK